MRENESDSEDGRPRPDEHISPWVPRDTGEAGQVSGGLGAGRGAVPSDIGDQDTIAFGSAAGEAAGHGRGSRARRDYPGQPWYAGQGDEGGEAGHGDQSGYGDQGGYGSYRGGYGSYAGPGGHRQGGYGGTEYGTAGWGLSAPPPPPRSRRGGRFLVYAAVAALAAGIGAGITVALANHDAGPAAGMSSSNIPAPHHDAAGSGSSSLNEATVEKKVEPGLVDILSTLKYDSETAEGTGMILTGSGLVLTNNHVIDGATTVKVSLAEDPGQSYQARVVGDDSTDDVALLQLDGASGLTAVSFGDSSQVKIGIPVLALGNAEGRGGVTPAAGYIDALNRSIQANDEGSGTTEDLNHMLQTNAQIQQGDSGGALANDAGQVIGMVTAANTAAASGQLGQGGGTIGFAIPINSALKIARQIDAGKPSSTVYIGLPGFLGVEVAQSNSPNPQQQAADEQRAGNGPEGPGIGGTNGSSCVAGGQEPAVPPSIAPAGTGALIVGILCGTAADSRGLAPGDVITSVNGQAVTTPGSLTDITARYHPGAVVSVGWESVSGAKHTTSITLGTGPAR